MAAPVVTVSFTADVLSGASPLSVQFTNTSNVAAGFARKFLWDFGDGSISEAESPSHVFTGTGGDTFDVSLAILATTGEFDVFSSSTLSATRQSNIRLASGGWLTNDDAWANRVLAPLPNAAVRHTLSWNGAQFFYVTNTPTLSFKSASSSLAFVLIRMVISSSEGITVIEGDAVVNGITGGPTAINVFETHSRLRDITTASPMIAEAIITPLVQLADTTGKRGTGITFSTRTYNNTASQGFGENEEPDYIQIGLPPVAEFSGAPLAGPNNFSVQFENLSTEAIELPTTYSWKKRISGSGDSFVEFSTEKNPSEIFTK